MEKKARNVKGTGSVYYSNSEGKWIGQAENGKYSDGRVKYKRFFGNSQNSVIEKMREFKQNNATLFIDNPHTTNILVSDFISNFLETIKKTKLKPSSYTRNVQTARNHIIPILGNYDLTQLTPQIIQVELINKMIEKGYSFSSIHKVYILLNEGLRYAFRQGLIPSNPCDLVEEPSKKIFINTKEIRFFNDEEIKRFKECALLTKNGKYHYKNGLALVSVIYTGIRVGELMSLKWKDVDLDNGFLRIHSNSVAAYIDDKRQILIQDSTKTKRGRIVRLTKSAKECYQEMRKAFNPTLEDYVFTTHNSRDTNRAMNTYTFICKRAGIPDPQGVHTLRHTCASLLIRKGVDIKIISEMLGHSSVSFTYNTYIHLLEEEKAKTIGELDI